MVRQLPLAETLAAQVRDVMEWTNERRDLVRGVRALRHLLPGDPLFGDPLSTAGTEPSQLVGRRLWAINHGRWTAAGETGLAFLQVAEWAARREQARERPRELAIVFTDLVGFSSWALEVGDESALDLLREVGMVVEGRVDGHGGRIIKRLGDGVMAVFDEPADALLAMHESIEGVETLEVRGYRPRLRAGLHVGRARRLGEDYLGVDVNIAARICEDANEGEALVSGPALERLDGTPVKIQGRRPVKRPGVPSDLEVHVAVLDGAGSSG